MCHFSLTATRVASKINSSQVLKGTDLAGDLRYHQALRDVLLNSEAINIHAHKQAWIILTRILRFYDSTDIKRCTLYLSYKKCWI